ncbi:MAG: non-heme iron oxygenase ferredoxin subunit [Propionicimonas sp.]
MSFVRACAVSDVPLGSAMAVDFGGEAEIAVVNTTGGFFAIQDQCSHAAVPLSDGDVEGCTLECYMHGSLFDLRTGQALNLPAVQPVPVYPVRIVGDDLYLDPDHPIEIQEQ